MNADDHAPRDSAIRVCFVLNQKLPERRLLQQATKGFLIENGLFFGLAGHKDQPSGIRPQLWRTIIIALLVYLLNGSNI
jgi:hypothetical protein